VDDNLLSMVARAQFSLKSFVAIMPCTSKAKLEYVENVIRGHCKSLEMLDLRYLLKPFDGPVEGELRQVANGRLSPVLAMCPNLREVFVEALDWPILDGDVKNPVAVPQVTKAHVSVNTDRPKGVSMANVRKISQLLFPNAEIYLESSAMLDFGENATIDSFNAISRSLLLESIDSPFCFVENSHNQVG